MNIRSYYRNFIIVRYALRIEADLLNKEVGSILGDCQVFQDF